VEPFQGKQFVGLKAVAHWLDLSESTVRRMVRTKRFPQPIRVGGVLKFDVGDLMTWIAAKKIGLLEPDENDPPEVKSDPPKGREK